MADNKMTLRVGDAALTATLADNSSSAALVEMLREKPLTIHMHDYANMEKVGPIGRSLPTNDEHIHAKPCDLILYLGDSFVIYYAPNTWSFTRLGRIEGISPESLKTLLGRGDVSVTLELLEH